MRAVLTVLVALMLAACGSAPKEPEPVAEVVPEPAPAKVETPRLRNSTLKYLAGRNLKPQPTRPLNVKSRCAHKDAIGTQTRLDLLVKEAEIKTFAALVTMKGYGSCRFDLKEFEQVQKLPQPLLRHRQASDCTVRMWEQGRTVTIAFNSCPKSCDGKAFDYLWPVVVDAGNGRCH
jgi:hypothetical protein